MKTKIAFSLILSFIKVAIAIYLLNEAFGKEVIEYTLEKLFYAWCAYLIMSVQVEIKAK